MNKYIALLMLLSITSCSKQVPTPNDKPLSNNIFVVEYEVNGSHYTRICEKFTIEGHEYLVFSAKVASSPFVIHNENCPCKKNNND